MYGIKRHKLLCIKQIINKNILPAKEIQPSFCNKFKWNTIHKNIKSLCRIPEMNIRNQLYINDKKRRKPSSKQ